MIRRATNIVGEPWPGAEQPTAMATMATVANHTNARPVLVCDAVLLARWRTR